MATVYAPPKNDAYTVLLTISLGALVLGCLLLFMDWSEYSGPGGKKPPTPPQPASVQLGEPSQAAPAAAPPGQPTAPATQPSAPPAGAPGNPPPEGK
jgi:hypothetical protein